MNSQMPDFDDPRLCGRRFRPLVAFSACAAMWLLGCAVGKDSNDDIKSRLQTDETGETGKSPVGNCFLTTKIDGGKG